MKKLLIFVAALLLSVAVMGTSLAEYGYKVLHKAIPVRNYIKDRLEEE